MVNVPPSIAQKPIGIKSRESGISVRLEIRETTGMYRAAAPTFCMKLEIIPTELEIMGIILFSVFPPYFNIIAASCDISPVLSNPAPIIITAIIDITALEEKPSNKVFASTKPSNPGT